jgi:hypothetical protein
MRRIYPQTNPRKRREGALLDETVFCQPGCVLESVSRARLGAWERGCCRGGERTVIRQGRGESARDVLSSPLIPMVVLLRVLAWKEKRESGREVGEKGEEGLQLRKILARRE